MKIATFFSMTLFLLVVGVDARYNAITSRRQYNEFINEYPYAVVCFAHSQQQFVDRSKKQSYLRSLALFKKALKSAAASGNYKSLLKKEVGFLIVDISKKTAQGLADPFYFSEMPSCILLQDGEPIDEDGNPVKISGFSTKREILDFLYENVGDELDEIVEKKQDQLEKEQAERIARYESYNRYPWGVWGPGYYGYSVYAPYPYYYRSHVGFGIVL